MTPPDPAPPKNRAALLLVHGIGQQNPYDTLDNFARGIIKQQVKRGNTPRTELRINALESGERVCLRISGLDTPYDELDLYEIYWAELVQGRIGLQQILWWLLNTVVTPLRFWQQQLPFLLRVRGRKHVLLVIFRELLQAVLLLGVSFGLIYLVLLTGFYYPQITNALQTLMTTFPAAQIKAQLPTLLAVMLLSIIVGFLSYNIAGSLLSAWRISRKHKAFGVNWAGVEASALKDWVPASLAITGILSVILVLLIRQLELPLATFLADVLAMLTRPPVLWALLLSALAWWGGRLLVVYVGDIVLYVTADRKSVFFRTREDIRNLALQRLKDLLVYQDAKGYGSVFIAGHSLGSVIAYDTINALAREVRADTSVQTHKLRGLLTFGSPLDKVYYFFRHRVHDAQAIKTQVLAFLHSSKRKPAGLDYGPYGVTQAPAPFASLYWMNLYSTLDFVSDYLDFYDVNVQHDMGYMRPVVAHSAYWQDDAFYEYVHAWLQHSP